MRLQPVPRGRPPERFGGRLRLQRRPLHRRRAALPGHLPRNGLIETALLQEREHISHIPLYNQVIPWAATQKVELPHRADNRIDWRALKVQ